MIRKFRQPRAVLAGSALLVTMLCGCESKFATVTPDLQAAFMKDLQAGKLNLDCGLKCDITWISQAPQIHALDLAENWNDLAVRVMQIGYGSDLAYYYLGQAAQGLGYHQAAITYYGNAMQIASGPNALLKCGGGDPGSDACQGVDLMSSIPVLIQASRDAMAAQAVAAADPPPAPHYHHARARQAAHWSAPPAVTPASASSGGSGWVAPPPAAQTAAAQTAAGQ